MSKINLIELADGTAVEAWHDPRRDIIMLKVRRFVNGEKTGVIVALTTEALPPIPSGGEYPRVATCGISEALDDLQALADTSDKISKLKEVIENINNGIERNLSLLSTAQSSAEEWCKDKDTD